jgi:triosephosphate isomerase
MTRPRYLIGTSLKTYFTHASAITWSAEVAQACRENPAVIDGAVEVFVLPTFLSITGVRATAKGSPLRIGAQDLSAWEPGAHTGEVTAAELAEVGCTLVTVGHAERRRDHGETDEVVAAKVAAALRHGLVPLVCVGEHAPGPPLEAAAHCRAQAHAALEQARRDGLAGDVMLAYEPIWAIGAPQPAKPEHIREVCRELRAVIGADGSAGEAPDVVTAGRVLYGGSAGPGLLTQIGADVDGLFLGRFAHDPAAVRDVLTEAAASITAERASQ